MLVRSNLSNSISFFIFNLVDKDESETPVSTPPQFSIQKLDPTSVLIEAIVPEDEQPAAFDDVYDVFSKKEKIDDDWTKVCAKFDQIFDKYII